mgnify:CR=1 FL=1|jgi:hypothetical protein
MYILRTNLKTETMETALHFLHYRVEAMTTEIDRLQSKNDFLIANNQVLTQEINLIRYEQ